MTHSSSEWGRGYAGGSWKMQSGNTIARGLIIEGNSCHAKECGSISQGSFPKHKFWGIVCGNEEMVLKPLQLRDAQRCVVLTGSTVKLKLAFLKHGALQTVPLCVWLTCGYLGQCQRIPGADAGCCCRPRGIEGLTGRDMLGPLQ